MANRKYIVGDKIYEETTQRKVIVGGKVLEETTAAGGFIPYPNPRYSMAGGMQVNTGGMN